MSICLHLFEFVFVFVVVAQALFQLILCSLHFSFFFFDFGVHPGHQGLSFLILLFLKILYKLLDILDVLIFLISARVLQRNTQKKLLLVLLDACVVFKLEIVSFHFVIELLLLSRLFKIGSKLLSESLLLYIEVLI